MHPALRGAVLNARCTGWVVAAHRGWLCEQAGAQATAIDATLAGLLSFPAPDSNRLFA